MEIFIILHETVSFLFVAVFMQLISMEIMISINFFLKSLMSFKIFSKCKDTYADRDSKWGEFQ